MPHTTTVGRERRKRATASSVYISKLRRQTPRYEPGKGVGRLWRAALVISEVLGNPKVRYFCPVIIPKQHVLSRERSMHGTRGRG